jgi:RNA polymerase sigma-70 factor (ECF subfamily)
VRRKGHEIHDAQDLTQEFFARFLAKDFLSQVDRNKGKFRSFLLASVKHFLSNEWDRAQTRKRGGDYAFTPWDEMTEEQQFQLESLPNLPAEKVYERRWALALLETVSARLREECVAAGKAELFGALRIYLSGEKSASYAEAAAQLNMTPGAIQVAVYRLRRRYGELLRAEIAHTVASPDEIDEEIRYLFSTLGE